MKSDSVKSQGPIIGKPLRVNDRAEMRDFFEDAIQRAGRRQLHIQVPADEGLMQRIPGLHFHFKPEVFLQIHGRTVFRFPKESIELRPGDLCVVPAGLPHGELVYSEPDRPFRNLVAGFYSNTLSLHLGKDGEYPSAAARDGEPLTCETLVSVSQDRLATTGLRARSRWRAVPASACSSRRRGWLVAACIAQSLSAAVVAPAARSPSRP